MRSEDILLILGDGQGHTPFPSYSSIAIVSSSSQDINPARNLSRVIFPYIAASLGSNSHWDYKGPLLSTGKAKGKKKKVARSVDFLFQLLFLLHQQPFNPYTFQAILAFLFITQFEENEAYSVMTTES